MKTAILLSGQIRDARNCFPTHKTFLIDQYNADVFIDTWSPNNNTLDHRGQLIKNDLTPNDVFDLYKPKFATFEDFDNSPLMTRIGSLSFQSETAYNAYDGTYAYETKIQNVIYMYYKIWRVFELMRQYEQLNNIVYDQVIRMRFDLFFESFPIIECKENTVYVPAGFDHRGGISDLLSMGTRATMQIACSVYTHLLEYYNMGIGLHPESVLRRHFEIEKLNIERFNIRYKLRNEYV